MPMFVNLAKMQGRKMGRMAAKEMLKTSSAQELMENVLVMTLDQSKIPKYDHNEERTAWAEGYVEGIEQVLHSAAQAELN